MMWGCEATDKKDEAEKGERRRLRGKQKWGRIGIHTRAWAGNGSVLSYRCGWRNIGEENV